MFKRLLGMIFIMLSFTVMGAKVRNYGITKGEVIQIVYDTTKVVFDEYHDEWNNILLGTLAAETDLGSFKGKSTHGIAQITPVAYKFIKKNLMSDKETYVRLKESGLDFKKIGFNDLTHNHRASITAMALYYKYVVEAKKVSIHKKDKAEVWKKYYNTYAGSGTKEHFNKAYKRNKSLIDETILVCKENDIRLAKETVVETQDEYVATNMIMTQTNKFTTFTTVLTKKTDVVARYIELVAHNLRHIKVALVPQVYIS